MRAIRSWVKTRPPVRAAAFVVQNAYHALVQTSASGPARDTAPPTHHLTAMVRVKDEARFLPEWLAHHVNIGFEHVYVYDNNSTDDIEHVIAPFVERGLATYVRWPTVPASPSSNVDFLTRFGAANEWVAFFDADEFLVESSPGMLREVLAEAGRAPAIAVCWRYYGSSGHETVPDGLITAAFDHADAGYNPHVKVIARPAMVRRYRNSHNLYYRGGRLARTPDGRRVFGSFVTPAETPRLLLHHYVYRSREDYERKARHGFVDAGGAKEKARTAERSDREFTKHNDVHAPLPAAILAATAERLADLGYGPTVGATRAERSSTGEPSASG